MSKIIANSEYAFSIQILFDGDVWSAYSEFRDVAPAGVEYAWIATGDVPVLFRGFVDTLSEPVEICFYENAVSDAPDAVVPYALKRNTSDTTDVTVEDGGTITDPGDALVVGCVTVGASPDPLVEFYLEANTQYLMTVRNVGAANTDIYTRFFWVG